MCLCLYAVRDFFVLLGSCDVEVERVALALCYSIVRKICYYTDKHNA